MVPLVDRMKKDYASHENGQTSTNAGVRLPKQPVMDTFVVTTSANQKASFDKAVAKFFYACNIPFVAAESEQFKVKTPNCKAKSFIRAQTALGVISDELSRLSLKLMSLAPSSAGIERAFSTMGYVEGDLRNSLSSEKTEKLAFCMRCLKK